jgi:hypothetical protein
VSEEELITGDPVHVADQIVAQCGAVGAGHVLGIINMVAPKPAILEGHLLFQERGNPGPATGGSLKQSGAKRTLEPL